MKKAIQRAVRGSRTTVLKTVLTGSAKAVAKLPGGEASLAKIAAENSRGFPSDAERELTGRTGRKRPLQNQIAHLMLENAPEGQEALAQKAQAFGVESADLLERVASRTDDLDTAVALRRRAVELEPKVAHRRVALAESLLQLTERGVMRDPVLGLTIGEAPTHQDEALQELQTALKLAPGHPYVLHALGHLLFERGEANEGLAHLEAAVAKQPQGTWLRELADLYRKPHVAQFEHALRAYERAFRRNSGDSKALEGILNIGVRATLDWPRLWKHAREAEKKRKTSPYHDKRLKPALDELFTEQADAETVEIVLKCLASLSTQGRVLRPEVQRFAASRIQFLGYLVDGFDLHKDLAWRKAERLLKLPVKEVGTLRQLMQPLLYVGEHSQAAQLSDPRFWTGADPETRQRLQKLHADAELMRGNLQPYLEYSRQARKRAPLPGDEQMEALIRGKRVAIVGPADTGDRLGQTIDEYDVVVRTNYNPEFVAAHTDTMGSRTDIAYYGGRDLGEILGDIQAAVERGDLKLAVGRPLSYDAHQHLNLPWLRFYRHEFPLYFHGLPLGVQRMSYDLLQFEPAQITLFNTDFYTGQFTAGYRDSQHTVFGPGSMLNDLIVQHDLLFDFRFMQALQATGVVNAFGKAGRVLGMTPRQYIQQLESEESLGRAQTVAQEPIEKEVPHDEAQARLNEARRLKEQRSPGISRDPVRGLVQGEVASHMEEAAEELRAALEFAPGNPTLLWELGTLLFNSLGELEEGLAYMEAAVAKEPKPAWLRTLAAAYRRPHVAQFDKALTAYERAFAANPKDTRALEGILSIGVRATLEWERIWESAKRLERRQKNSPAADDTLRANLNRIFGPDPSQRSVAAVLRDINKFARQRKHLHPTVHKLVATRLQFLGSVREGFELIQAMAGQAAHELLSEPVTDISTLQKVMGALVYTGDYEQASRLSEPRFWRAEDTVSYQQAEKLHADAELLRGNPVPYLAYAEKARQAAPLPGEQEMAELIRGKRVAIVGPADTGDRLGSVIDEYDVVVRANYNPDFVAANHSTQGSRTDIAYYNGRDIEEMLQQLEGEVESGGLKMIVGRPLSYSSLKDREIPWLRFYRTDFPLYFQGHPLGVQRMSYDLLQFEPAEITLFNTDFYTGQFAVGYRAAKDTVFGPGSMLNDLLVQHDLSFDFTFMQALVSTGVVNGAGKSGRVLARTKEQYLRQLETKGVFAQGQAAEEAAADVGTVESPEAQQHLDTARELLQATEPGIINDPVRGLVRGEVPAKEKEALAELGRALEIDPGNAVLLYEQGRILFGQGQIEAGLAAMEAAVAKNPDAEWLRTLAGSYRQTHVAQFDKALYAYERAFRRDPKDTRALQGILNVGARGTMDWGRIWRSARRLEQSIEESPLQDDQFSSALNRIFSPKPSDNDVATALDAIEAATVRGQDLQSAVLGCVAVRLQFMGHLGAGYDLRAKLAESRLGGGVNNLPQLRARLRALVYLDQYDQAAVLSDPQFWPTEDPMESERHRKLHADAALLRGDLQPYVDYSAAAREQAPLPAEQKMAELISGKRVAIVAPADTGDELGEVIDGFDVIIRPRFSPDFVAENKHRVGSRTDIAYVNGRDLEDHLEDMRAAVEAGELQAAVARPLSFYRFRNEQQDWLRFYRQEFSLYFHGFALGVPRWVYDILQFEPAEICVFNSDMYTGTDAFAAGYRDSKDYEFGPGSVLNDLIMSHDLKFDFKLLKQLQEAGILTAQGKSAEVLELSPQEYVDVLEAGGALGRPQPPAA